MTGRQIQAARALLGWSQADLAQAAEVSIPTVKRAEGSGRILASAKAIEAIGFALRNEGIFFQENGDETKGIGVSYDQNHEKKP